MRQTPHRRPTPTPWPARPLAGALLLLLLTSWSVGALLWRGIAAEGARPERDPVTIHEARIAPLKALLPAAGAVGYVTTVPNDRIFAPEKGFGNVEYLAQYALTQYTLAPLVVRNSPAEPLVVGNFLDGPPPPGELARHGLVPVRDLGDGVVLFRREVSP